LYIWPGGSFPWIGYTDYATSDPGSSIADRLTPIIWLRVDDHCTSEDWVLLSLDGNVAHGDFIMGFALAVCLDVAKVAGMTVSTSSDGMSAGGHYNPDIGYPKLFMVSKASAAEPWPRRTVNNFVAARGEPIRMANALHLPVSVNRFSRPGGPGLLTLGRFNDYDLIDQPVGRGLAL